MAIGEEILNEIRCRWADQMGDTALAELENGLKTVVGERGELLDTAGWLARSSAE